MFAHYMFGAIMGSGYKNVCAVSGERGSVLERSGAAVGVGDLKTMSDLSSDVGLRMTGVDVIGSVPWGTHFCQFYQTKQDLIDVLVPYFRAGLLSGEFCMWITSEPLGVDEAIEALTKVVPDLPKRIANGQIEILPYDQWYVEDGKFDQQRVLDGWVSRLDAALARGLSGLRLSGNTFWLEKDDWQDFTDYEEAVNSVIGNYPMLAFCTYSIDKCGAGEIADVVANHEFALMRRHGKWSIIESSTVRQAKEALEAANEELRVTEESLRTEIEERARAQQALQDERDFTAGVLSTVGALVVVLDKNGRIVRFNRACEELSGYAFEEVHGRALWELLLLPEERKGVQDTFAQLVSGDFPNEHRNCWVRKDGSTRLIEWSNTAMMGDQGEVDYVIGTGIDITDRIQAEAEVNRHKEEALNRERRIAQILQRTIVPEFVPEMISDCSIAALYRPASKEADIGGDFYDVFDLGDNKIGILIGDVAGKGLGAAMRVAAARYAFRSYAYLDPRPARVVTLANEALCRDNQDQLHMLTAFFGVVDTQVATLTYATAGHEPPIICQSDGVCEELEPGGLPLGIKSGVYYTQTSKRINSGDIWVLFTDGITEARSSERVLFGRSGVKGLLTEKRGLALDALASSLMERATEHADGELQDDAAIVLVKIDVKTS